MSITQSNHSEHHESDDCCHENHGCSCCHTGPTYLSSHDDEGGEEGTLFSPAVIVGASMFVIGLVFDFFGEHFLPSGIVEHFDSINSIVGIVFAAFFFVAYLLIGCGIVKEAALGIAHRDMFNENTLMVVASIGAFIIGEYPEAVAVMLFYRIGEYLQDRAVNQSKSRIRKLLDIRPDAANLITESGIIVERAENIAPSSHILVKPGERVPLDGIIIDGQGSVDMSALTGESAPVYKAKADEILAGCMNMDGMLTINVTKAFGESTASRIIALVENAEAGKAKTENFITRFARVYTPIVVALAFLFAVIPPLLGLGAFSVWVYRALTFLVVSCPCALVVSIPVGFFGGIGAASSRGILIKGGNYLEVLAIAETVVFDKTGTLTYGSFAVSDIEAQAQYSSEDVLRYAAMLEANSTHPLALSIVKKYNETQTAPLVDFSDTPKELSESAGLGVSAVCGGKSVVVGNDRMMQSKKIALPDESVLRKMEGAVVHIAVDGVYAGAIYLVDTIKPDSKQAVTGLFDLGVKRTIMLTGDREETAEAVVRKTGLTKAVAGLMPWQKVEAIESIMGESSGTGSVVYMGDGINDAPVLARADAGIAMGALGSDAAIEAADIVIMDDAPSKLITAIRIARKTKTIIRQNIVFSLGTKGLVIALAAVGLANMWVAVFADVGVALLAVANALRAGRAAR